MREFRSYQIGRPLLGAILALVCLSACSEQVNDFLRFDRFQAVKSSPSLAYLNASSDLIDVSNSTGLTINGTCSAEGKPVIVSGAASATAICTGGAWSAVVDASAAADGLLTFTVDHIDAQGNRATPVTVTIPKDTSTSTLATFTKSDARIAESNTTSSFSVQISSVKLYDTVLNYVVSGTAANGTDHGLSNGTVTIPAGQTSATVNFNILNNALVQNERRLAVTLTQSNRKTIPLGSTSSFFLDIADDDSGAYHTLASYTVGSNVVCLIFEDNKMKCWGDNAYGQIGDGTLVTRLTPVAVDAATSYAKVIGGGGPSNCAITLAGTVKCWGWNGGGQLGDGSTTQRTSPVLSNGGATFLSASGGAGPHYCGITTANKLRCWGLNSNGQIGDGTTSTQASGVIVDGTLDYAKTAVGESHSCGITTTGILKCWGNNSVGQVGDGTTTQRLLPVTIDAGTSYSYVAAGYNNTCAITTTGILKCWGANASGQLGDGTTTQRLLPVIIDSGVTYSAVEASKNTSPTMCGLTAGQLKCWGYNMIYSMVGDGTTTNRTSPVSIDPGTTYTSISGGSSSMCAQTTAGALKCWGSNAFGQTVQPYTSSAERLPISPQPALTYSAVARGVSHTCGILSTGKLRCWGLNSFGQLGDGTLIQREGPVEVDSATTYAKISAGASHTCGLLSTGKLKCWGLNTAGQLGDGTTTNRLSPVPIDSGTSYSEIAVGDNSTCALTVAGALKCWGENIYGQLGDGTTTNRLSPVTINSGTSYKSIAIGSSNACGVTTGKVLKCWGDNTYGQLGDGTTTLSLTPLVIDTGVSYATAAVSTALAFGQFACAITDLGVLKCWGSNSNSQLGDGTTTDRLTPVIIDAGTSYSSVSATFPSACAKTVAGALKCWGSNGYGQAGAGAANTVAAPAVVDAGVTYSSVSLNRRNACGVAAGTLKCWGDTANGLMGRGDRYMTPTNVSRIFEP